MGRPHRITYQLEIYLRVLNIPLDHPVTVYFDDLPPMGLIFHRLVVGIGHIFPGIVLASDHSALSTFGARIDNLNYGSGRAFGNFVRKVDVLPGEGGNQANVQCVGEPEEPTGTKRPINRHAIGDCDRHRYR